MRILFTILFWVFLIAQVQAATIYIDATMGADCTSGNYSIANRNCTGSDGNAYNDMQTTFDASSAGDTINFRAGNITSNASGDYISVKANQTIQTYPGDLPSRANITGVNNSTRENATFRTDGNSGVTFKNLHLLGGGCNGIIIWNASNVTVQNVEVEGWNVGDHDFCDAISALAYDSAAGAMTGIVFEDNNVHDPANKGDAGCLGQLCPGVSAVYGFKFGACVSCVVGGGNAGVSAGIMRRNTISNTGGGISMDVEACSPGISLTPCQLYQNTVNTVDRFGFIIEVGSTCSCYNNIIINSGETGLWLRIGGTTVDQFKFQNNTIYGFAKAGIWISSGGVASLTNSSFDNNIIYSSTNTEYLLIVGSDFTSTASNTWRNNLFHAVNNSLGVCWATADDESTYTCTGSTYADSNAALDTWEAACSGPTCSNNIAGDPLFVNAGAGNFHLQSSSPARNTGLTIGSFNTDYDNVSRPQPAGGSYDIGAFEFPESGKKKVLYAPGSSDTGERYLTRGAN